MSSEELGRFLLLDPLGTRSGVGLGVGVGLELYCRQGRDFPPHACFVDFIGGTWDCILGG